MVGRAETLKSVATGTTSAERVADVLLSLARNEGSIGITAISRELGLSKAVVYRILQSLASRDLVAVDPHTREYRLGASATALGARALRQLDLRKVARDPLLRLRDETQETTTLSLLAIDRRTYVDQFESAQEIKMTVELGRLYPLYAGASSRSILAFLPEPEIARVIEAGLDKLTDETILDPSALRSSLSVVKAHGYAVSQGERQSGAGSVSAPIFQGDHRVIGSISVCGPLARFDSQTVARYIPMVMDAAREISALMGWEAPTSD